jgi:protein-S-isoprenylcysteine O-methyltransferase Ste14
MSGLLRHLLAIVALPFTVAVLVPLWLARRNDTRWTFDWSPPHLVSLIAGACALLVGVALFAASLRRFAGEGEGTLAPWDPPRRLVVTGPYRFVRNPMISGVLFLLLGEASVLRSAPHLSWALIFLAINAVYIPLAEEPMLRTRFGAAYDEYCRNVPRLVPRLRPWTP